MVIPKLAFSNMTSRKARVVLTVTAIALSVSLVVAVTSGYASVEAAAYRFLTQYLGSTDLTITRSNDPRGGVSQAIVPALNHDPRVKRAVGRVETDLSLVMPNKKGDEEPGRIVEATGVRRPDDTQVERMSMSEGHWFDSDTGDVAVVDQAVSELTKRGVGDEITLQNQQNSLTLKVVGIVHKPTVLAEARPTVYIPLRTLQQFIEYGPRVTRITVELQPGVSHQAFGQAWSQKLKELDPAAKLKLTGFSREDLSKNLLILHLVSYLGGLVSMVAATFIVFSALSMGVTERQRTLAMLRAVGAFRLQIAGLVVFEGLILAVIGAGIGVLLGAAWIHLLAWKFDQIFYGGVILSGGGIAFGVIGSIVAALLASLLPAWNAARVSPLEAMTPLARPDSREVVFVCAAVGLVLIAIDPFVLFGPLAQVLGWFHIPFDQRLSQVVKFYTHFAVGLPAVMLGFFLLSPLFVWVVESVLAPPVSLVLGLRYALVRQQLSSGVWRAAGTATALMVGLAVLIVLQTEGTTAVAGWKIPDKFPDIFIVNFAGIPLSDVPKLNDVPGIRAGELTPIAIASPGLPNNFFGLSALMIMPNATMFFGIDPNEAFKLMELDFREGNAKDAERMLKMGRHVVVTNEFKQLKGLGVGDKITLQTIHGPQDYTIAGVVWSPGIDVIVSVFDMGRQMDERTAASMFGSLEDAKRDFGVERFYLFAANLNYSVEKEQLLKEVQHALRLQGMRAGDVREIKFRIEQTFYRLLLLVSTVAFAAMAVAALGVTNTILASIRTRRWQFGILRSVGLTRAQLLRLVLAEAVLLGLVGCVMGVASGLEMSVNAEAVAVVVTGYRPPIVIPWHYVWIGIAIVIVVSVVASIGPAILVARSQPLDLLQAGRAAT